MIHDIDLASWIFGSACLETRSIGLSILGGHEDVAQSRLQFACGGVANLTASRCSYQSRRVLRLFGPAGFANVDLTANKVDLVRVPNWVGQREFNFQDTSTEQHAFVREQLFEAILPKEEIFVEPTNAIAMEHQDWLKAIATKRQPLVSLEQAANSIDIAARILGQIKSHQWRADDEHSTGPFATFDTKQTHATPIPAFLTGNSRRRQAA
jgi:predicted dehydrogenase